VIRTQIQLTEEQSRRVKEVARRENISMAEVIRNAIDAWLEQRSDLTEEQRWAQSLNAIGKFHSGVTDLAENHDKYLTEAYEDIQER
jgi:Arc/MetJ-type ribon-helix-helix transcriptional regulator